MTDFYSYKHDDGPTDPESSPAPSSTAMPPHDLEAEAVVLSESLMSAEQFALVSATLEPKHFFGESHRRIWEALVALTTAAAPVDVTSVASWLRDHGRLAHIGGSKALAELIANTPCSSHIEVHAERVRAFGRLRDVIAAARQIASEGYAVTGIDVQRFLDEAERTIYDVARVGAAVKSKRMSDVVQNAYEHLLAAETRGGAVELPTGLLKLDKFIGGLGRGRVTVLAARPGMGKTALATGFAENIAHAGGNVVFFSMEMPAWQLGTRLGCTRAGVSVVQAMNGWLPAEQRTRYLRALDEIKSLPIIVDDAPALTLLQLRSKARVAASKLGPPALIVVDYLQLMRGEVGSKNNREREVSEITAGMKTLAKEMDCSVVLLSQLNRALELDKDKRPRLSNLRDSGGIEQDADDVVFIYRDEYYHADTDDKGVAELIVAKQRNGPTGPVRVGFDGPATAFYNLTDPDDIH